MKKKGVEKEPKYLTENKFSAFENKFNIFENTFEKSMRSIARSFEKVFEKLDRHDKVFEVMLKEMQTNSQEAREHRMMMGSLNHSDVIQERRIKGLELRIEKIEEKIK